MSNAELLSAIFDILAQNEVSESARLEVLRRVDSVDTEDGTILFDHDGENANLQLRMEG